MKTGIAKWVAMAVSGWILAGCHTMVQYPDQPPLTTAGSVERSRVRFNVVRDLDELQAKCMNRDPNYFVYACAYPYIDHMNPKRSVCTVFAFLPDGPADTTKIAILGHEVWHCFGAAHIDARAVAAHYR